MRDTHVCPWCMGRSPYGARERYCPLCAKPILLALRGYPGLVAVLRRLPGQAPEPLEVRP